MKAIHNITYGLYILTATTNKMNGCIINTLMQVTSTPELVSITVNNDNETTKMIKETGVFNVSILTKSTKFSLIQKFGFASGRDIDKFKGFGDYKLAENGVPYITQSTNAYLSAKVVDTVDLGTHTTFFAEVVESKILTNEESVTYADYHSYIKPKQDTPKKGVYVCKVCGYIHESETLPKDFVCPICKHGADVFEYRAAEPKEELKKKYYCPVCDRIELSAERIDKCSVCGGEMIEVEE